MDLPSVRKLSHFATALALLFCGVFAFAGPGRTTYQAKIIKPDGYPLEASNVNFKFTILDSVGTCILYSETYSAVNMTSTGGLVSFSLGSGVKTYPVSSPTFEDIFSNITPNLSCDAGGPGSISPTADEMRKIVMQFHDGNGWQTLPAMNINAVPYAMYATNAEKLGGISPTSFIQDSEIPTCPGGQALTYSGAMFTCITSGGGSVSAAAITAALGYTPADGASFSSLTSSVATSYSTVTSTVNSLGNSVTTMTSLVNAYGASITALIAYDSILTTAINNLTTSVFNMTTSMAAITSSQWTTSGSIISFSGDVEVGSLKTNGLNLLTSSGTNLFVGDIDNLGSGTGALNVGVGYHALNVNTTGTANVAVGAYALASNEDGTSNVAIGQRALQFNVSGSTNVAIGPFAMRSSTSGSRNIAIGQSSLRYVSGTENIAIGYNVMSGVSVSGSNNIVIGSNLTVPNQSGSSQLNIGGLLFGDLSTGLLGAGVSAPSARLHLLAGSTSYAPLKFVSGGLLASPQSGTVEYDGFNYYVTDGTNTRRAIATTSVAGSFDDVSSVNSTGNITLSPTGSVIVSGATGSTNSATGALIVNGGLGVAENIFASGTIITSSNMQATSLTATSGLVAPIIYGSTQNSGVLRLESTAHATKGYILMAQPGGTVGIGTATPLAKLSVDGDGFSPNAIIPGTVATFDNESADVAIGLFTTVFRKASIYFGITASASRGAVSYQFNSSSPSFDKMQFDVATQTRMVITGSGTVGIGTTAPTAMLHVVNNSASSNALVVSGNTTLSGTVLVSTGLGVGLGASTVSAMVHLRSPTAGNDIVYIDRADGSPNLDFYSSYSGLSDVQSGTFAYGVRPVNDQWQIWERGYNSSWTSLLALTKDGKLGINTQPSYPLHVVAASGVTPVIVLQSGSSANTTDAFSSWVSGKDNTGTETWWVGDGESGSKRVSLYSAIPGYSVQMGNSSGSILLNENGYVGIGIANPNTRLHIGDAMSNAHMETNTKLLISGVDSFLQIQGDDSAGSYATGIMLSNIPASGTNKHWGINHRTVNLNNVLTFGYGTSTVSTTILAGSTDLMSLTTSGSLGLGILNPTVNDSSGTVVHVHSSSGNAAGIRFTTQATGTGAADGIFVGKWTDGQYGNGPIFWNYENTPISFATSGSIKLFISASGAVGIGNTAPAYALDVSGDLHITGTPYRASGDIAWTVPSDARLKDVVRNYERGLNEILNINTVIYRYKNGNIKNIDSSKEFTGVLAQNVQEQIPEAVKTDKDGFLSLNTTPIFWAMINAIKEVYHKVLSQDREIASLKQENAELKAYLCEKDPQAKICK